MSLTEKNKDIDWQTNTHKCTKNSPLPTKIPISRCSPGFTLIELLTVVFIIGVLATIAIIAYSEYVKTAENVVAITEINMLEKELFGYGVENPTLLPPDLGAIHYGGFLDPWKHPYVYQPDLTVAPRTNAGNPINTDYDLYSIGRDGRTALDIDNPVSDDDIIRADNGGYKGLAERY